MTAGERWERFLGPCPSHQQLLGHQAWGDRTPSLCQCHLPMLSLQHDPTWLTTSGFSNMISAHSLHLEAVNSLGKEDSRHKVLLLHNINSFHSLFHLLFGNQGPNFAACSLSLNGPKSKTKTNEERCNGELGNIQFLCRE